MGNNEPLPPPPGFTPPPPPQPPQPAQPQYPQQPAQYPPQAQYPPTGQYPPQYAPQQFAPAGPPPAPKKKTGLIIGVAAAVVAAVVVGVLAFGGSDDKKKTTLGTDDTTDVTTEDTTSDTTEETLVITAPSIVQTTLTTVDNSGGDTMTITDDLGYITMTLPSDAEVSTNPLTNDTLELPRIIASGNLDAFTADDDTPGIIVLGVTADVSGTPDDVINVLAPVDGACSSVVTDPPRSTPFGTATIVRYDGCGVAGGSGKVIMAVNVTGGLHVIGVYVQGPGASTDMLDTADNVFALITLV